MPKITYNDKGRQNNIRRQRWRSNVKLTSDCSRAVGSYRQLKNRQKLSNITTVVLLNLIFSILHCRLLSLSLPHLAACCAAPSPPLDTRATPCLVLCPDLEPPLLWRWRSVLDPRCAPTSASMLCPHIDAMPQHDLARRLLPELHCHQVRSIFNY